MKNDTSMHRKTLNIIYVMFNVFYAFYFSYSGYLGGDFSNKGFSTKPELIFLSLLLILLVFFFINLIYRFDKRINIGKLNVISSHVDNKIVHGLFFAVFLFYVYCAYHGLGINGVSDDDVNLGAAPKYLYFILQPPFIIVVYFFACLGCRNFVYRLIFFGFFLMQLVTGAMANFILLLPYLALYSCKLDVRDGVRFRKRLIYFIVIGFLVAPLLRISKFLALSLILTNVDFKFPFVIQDVMRVLDNMSQGNGFFSLYVDYAFHTFERFQIVANMQYIIDRASDFSHYEYDFFRLHSIINFIYKSIYSNSFSPIWLESVIASSINDTIDWNVHISFWGRAIVLGIDSLFTYVFIVLLVLFMIPLSRKLSKELSELNWCYLVLFVIHGWFLSYFLYVQSLIVFLFLCIGSRYITMFFYAHFRKVN